MKSVPPDTLLVRGEQVQRSHDKKENKIKATPVQTVTLNVDELDFMI